jgi:hypothetical protein
MMNLDLIIKLARLANNNPNENEANLAARKVCKLMAEANFKFPSTQRFQRSPDDKVGGTWNDVHRSTEPQWRSSPPPPSGWDFFRDIFNREPYSYGSWTGFKSAEEHNKTPPKSPPKKEPAYDIKTDSFKIECCECGREFTQFRSVIEMSGEIYQRCKSCRDKEKYNKRYEHR